MTNGIDLYEVVDQRTVKNQGCWERSGGRYGPAFRYTIIRDCRSEATARIDDLDLAALAEVR